MSNYLVFDTQAAADTALETIYANMVEAINSPDLLNVDTQEVVAKDDLTPDEMVETGSDNRRYPIFGVNANTGIKNAADGYTTAWAVAQETTQGKWVFQKPDDSLMGGVVGYMVEPYSPDWFPTAMLNEG
jgi:hypothetical protein